MSRNLEEARKTAALARFGLIDALVNSAAITKCWALGDLERDAADFQHIRRVNVTGKP
jgi:NAD(P)-dependent dehydrogenase (short-subunit alcohol dehydrogenase family)